MIPWPMVDDEKRVSDRWRIGLIGVVLVLAITLVGCGNTVAPRQSAPTSTLTTALTALPPTSTLLPPTLMPVPPTTIVVPPTATTIPATKTPIPPTATSLRVPPTPTTAGTQLVATPSQVTAGSSITFTVIPQEQSQSQYTTVAVYFASGETYPAFIERSITRVSQVWTLITKPISPPCTCFATLTIEGRVVATVPVTIDFYPKSSTEVMPNGGLVPPGYQNPRATGPGSDTLCEWAFTYPDTTAQ